MTSECKKCVDWDTVGLLVARPAAVGRTDQSSVDIPAMAAVYGAKREYLSGSDELQAHYLLYTTAANN